MKIAGIIAEYNPFHSGHAYHIAQTRARSGCDYVAVCMAGSFTQRGEAACADKWARARAALNCGADAVFELPARWAVAPAEEFARGGVAILAGLGCDLLSFGCERADMALLRALARLRDAEPESLSEAVRAGLARGLSHPRARGEALAAHLGVDPRALDAPNLSLAVEYLRAIEALAPEMRPLPIPRAGDYRDLSLRSSAAQPPFSAGREGHPPAPPSELCGPPALADASIADACAPNLRADGLCGASEAARAGRACDPVSDPDAPNGAVFASASAIRAALARGARAAALECVPEAARAALESAPTMHAPDDLLLAALRRMDESALSALPGAGEGLENRLFRAARRCASRAELIESVKCKRYTYARISRMCACALLEIDAELCARHPLPKYARLIGLRADAKPLMAELRRRAKLPVAARARELADDEIFALECRATDLRALLCDAPEHRRAGREFSEKFVLV